jgi:hypothetical protein
MKESELQDLLTRHRESGSQTISIAEALADEINADSAKLFELRQFFRDGVQTHESVLLTEIFKRIDVIPETASYPPKSHFVYRGESLSPAQVIANGGFSRTGGSQSIYQHKQVTGSSIYVSTSTSLQIAMEHSCRFSPKFVYRIRAKGGICVNSFLDPMKFHSVEEEVVFPYRITLEQVDAVACAKNFNTMETDFYPMYRHFEFMMELVARGLVK